MTLQEFKLVCKKCGEIIEMKAHVIPSSGWHEYSNLGRPEQHSMEVVVEQED
jgi:hypothetical protein